MALRFVVRPSSALSYGSNLVSNPPGPRKEEEVRYEIPGADLLERRVNALENYKVGDYYPSPQRNPFQTRYQTNPYGFGGGVPTVDPTAVPDLSQIPVNTGSLGSDLYSIGDAVGDAGQLYGAGVNASVQAELEFIRKQRELQLQEQELREAMLNGDLARAKELLRDIEANKAALAEAYVKYRNTVNPHFDAAATAGKATGEATQAELGQIADQSAADQAAIASSADGSVSEFANKVGGTDASVAAAQELAAVGMEEYAALVAGQQEAAARVALAGTDAAVLGAEGDRAFELHLLKNREKRAMAGFDEQADAAAQRITDLEMRKKLFDLEKKRADAAHQKALEDAYGKIESMDSITFGRASAEQYFLNRAEAMGIADDRQALLLDFWSGAFEKGVFDRATFNDWFYSDHAAADGTQRPDAAWAQPLSGAEVALLGQMFDAYTKGRDTWKEGGVQTATAGGRIDYNGPVSSSGIPQNNRQVGSAARSEDSGQFYARQQFASQIGAQLKEMFGLSRVGQWRGTNVACGGNTGRSCNSDHYTGGALDLHGTKASMRAAAEYLRNQPYVGYVLFETSDGHHDDHVHVSFRIDYSY